MYSTLNIKLNTHVYIKNNVSFEGRDIHYRHYHSESDRTSCDTSGNVFQDPQNYDIVLLVTS